MDHSDNNYENVFNMATVFYLVSLILVAAMKSLLILNKRANGAESVETGTGEYVEFDN